MHIPISKTLFVGVALLGTPSRAETTSASDLIEAALEALGGREALEALPGVTYEYPEFVFFSVYRPLLIN